MEFFLHYITADIKYNFLCEEDGHQFRENWVKCRLNIKHLDSPHIQISCYPVNHLETVPLNINIDFADFHFERVFEVFGMKPNVFALLWTQQNQSSEFYIAIDNENQFKNYEIYLNSLLRICRIAGNERFNGQAIEVSSISVQNVASSSLSLFNGTNDILDNNMVSIEPMAINKYIEKEKRFGLSRMKNATKCAAKKFNQMFVKAKSTLITSVSSTKIQSRDVDASSEFEYLDLNNVSLCSSQSTIRADDDQYNEKYDLFNNSINSTIMPIKGVSDRSFSRNKTDTSVLSETNLNNRMVVIAGLGEIYAETDMILVTPRVTASAKPNEGKKIIRKGTPYKVKMSTHLTLQDKIFPPPEKYFI